jgi:tetratricopeptide (TPR) repeat protein/transglutaminase-like putative cysteine protease
MPYRLSLLFKQVFKHFLVSSSLAGALLCLSTSGAFAQSPIPLPSPSPQKPDSEEAAVIDKILNRVRFENDGTEVSETEATVRIQSQAGVEEFGQLVFGYSSATEKLEVDYVRVRKPNGQVVVTPESTAQDFAPEVLREAPMYSDYRQRHISVSSLQPGDTLEYRTVTRVLTPLAAGNFWYEYTFPKDVIVNENRLEINVPKSRDLKVKAPNRKPEIHDVGDRRTYTWVDKNSQPVSHPESAGEDEENHPDIQLTTFTDWKQVAQWYAKLQGERMVIDDSIRSKAAEVTKGASAPAEKARLLYDFVARNIRYVSISLGVGRYQPHLPAEVMQNGYGDCKDKHTLFAALLIAEGIQSYPVLIDSSRKLDPDVPSPAQFDHVITAARLGMGLTWLDTTPEVTPFGLILYQLRNKQAVLASADPEGGLQQTPADSPIKTFLHFSLNGKFSEFGAFDGSVELTAQGDRDWPMRRNFRQMSSSQWKEYVKAFSEGWGLPGDVDLVHLDSIEDTTKPFHLTYHLHQDRYFVVPSTGVSFRPIPPLALPPVRTNDSAEDSTAPIDVGPAGEIDYRVHLEFPSNYSVRTPTAVKMTRDYGEYSSSYSVNQGTMDGERKLVVTTNDLAAARRADYESFRNAAQSNEDQVLTCSITRPSEKAPDASAPKMDGTPAELQKAGMKALQNRDYKAAVDLLKRAVDNDSQKSPALKNGWYQLGEAYAGVGDRGEAIAAFRQQIKVDPNHKHATGDLARELELAGNDNDAIAAYRKQLALSPYEKSTLKDLGILLARLHRDSEAHTELEAAAAIPPGDPETKLVLAQVYARLGENSKAEPILEELTGSTRVNAGGDVYAAALRTDIDPAQTENEAQQVLYEIGGQFDAGEFDRLGPSALSAMQLVSLSWARIGWAKHRGGENLTAVRFLNAAWLLSQSGTVANRLAQVLEKQDQKESAENMYALAVAAGGVDAQDSRTRLEKLMGDRMLAEKKIVEAAAELVESRTLRLDASANKPGPAHLNAEHLDLVFDGSSRPERIELSRSNQNLQSAVAQFREKEFPVRFPDASSVKIIRQGLLSCGDKGCSLELVPLEKVK